MTTFDSKKSVDTSSVNDVIQMQESSARVQLKQNMASLSLGHQVDAMRPSKPLQFAGGGDTQGVHQAAAEGLTGSATALPHLKAIQHSFGRHDVSSVNAHVGGPARSATQKMGAEAYATGNSVAFKQSPSLHTAAHEAAHVVQQRGGVQLKGGVGSVGDAYEQHADAVADAVVQRKSAEGILDKMSGDSPSTGVQMRGKPKKGVSGDAMTRLKFAKKAIKHTKSVLKYGAGNQAAALMKTKMNSYYRLEVMRDEDGLFWELDESVQDLADANPEALTAAKADIARGGNCGEHADIAFNYLRAKATGQTITNASKEGLDHAFILIGNLSTEADDSQIVVSDPWPTKPTATLWEDHFAHTPDRSKIETYGSMVADGQNVKKVIAAGLKLTAAGKKHLKKKDSKKQTEQEIKDGAGGWVWNHEGAAGKNKDYKYVKEKKK